MRLGAILFTLGYGGCMIAGLMVIPWLLTLFDPAHRGTGGFTVALILTFFASGALLLSGFSNRRHSARGLELMLIMVLFWTVLPLVAALPLIGAQQIDSLLAAYFEAVSALTTSGGSVMAQPQLESAAILLWRALLGWLGGLWTLVFAVAVLAPFGIGGITLTGSPLLQHEEGAPLTSRLGRPLRLIFPIYLALTALGFLGLVATGTNGFNALCLSLSAISTSGLVNHSDALAVQLTLPAQMVLSVQCFIGALSIPLLLLMTLGARFDSAFRNSELSVLLVMIAFYAVISSASIPDTNLLRALMQSISLHSTAGFNLLADQQIGQWPLVWLMLPVLIGGMAMSTSGGIKVMRAIILFKDLGVEIGKLTYPSSVHPLQLEGRRLEVGDFNAAWAFTAIFILFVTLGVLSLGLFGMTLSDAWPVVLAALTNSLAITMHFATPIDYAAMGGALQIIITLLMIAGRIELLILMVMFTKTFWRYVR